MRFLIDAQLPPALARWLASQGQEAEHVSDIGLASAQDQEVWSYAMGLGAVVVTKDQDFAALAALQPRGPQVLWIRIGNCRRQVVLGAFGKLLPAILEALESGERLVEIA